MTSANTRFPASSRAAAPGSRRQLVVLQRKPMSRSSSARRERGRVELFVTKRSGCPARAARRRPRAHPRSVRPRRGARRRRRAGCTPWSASLRAVGSAEAAQSAGARVARARVRDSGHALRLLPLSEIELRVSRSSGPGGQHAQKSSTRVEALLDVEASTALTEIQKRRVVERAGAGPPRGRAGRAKPGCATASSRSSGSSRSSATALAVPRTARRRRSPRRQGARASARGEAPARADEGAPEAAGAGNRLAALDVLRLTSLLGELPPGADAAARQPRAHPQGARAGHPRALRRARRPHEHPPRRGARGEDVLLVPRAARRRAARVHRAGLRLHGRAGAARADAGARARGATVLAVPCLGHCELAPVAMRGDEITRRSMHRANDGAVARARRGGRDARRLRGARRARDAPCAARPRARSSRSCAPPTCGYGGAGFPTAAEWEAVLREPGAARTSS